MIMHSKPLLTIPSAVKYTQLTHLWQTMTGQVFSLAGVSMLSITSDYIAPKGKRHLFQGTQASVIICTFKDKQGGSYMLPNYLKVLCKTKLLFSASFQPLASLCLQFGKKLKHTINKVLVWFIYTILHQSKSQHIKPDELTPWICRSKNSQFSQNYLSLIKTSFPFFI